MYQALLTTHSLLRYVVLLLLVVVIIQALIGWQGKRPFTKLADKLSLFLLIFTHIQLLVGLFLYFVSPFVHFDSTTMKDATTRYWTMEHIVIMLIAVAQITYARVTIKKISEHALKYRRLFIVNFAALLLILLAIQMSHRAWF